jgi:hypothetical protein
MSQKIKVNYAKLTKWTKFKWNEMKRNERKGKEIESSLKFEIIQWIWFSFERENFNNKRILKRESKVKRKAWKTLKLKI